MTRTHRFRQSFRATIDPSQIPPFLGLIHSSNTRPSKVFHKFGQGYPTSGVHVEMLLVGDVFLIDLIGSNTFRSKPAFRNEYNLMKEEKEPRRTSGRVEQRIQTETDSKIPQCGCLHVRRLPTFVVDVPRRQHDT